MVLSNEPLDGKSVISCIFGPIRGERYTEGVPELIQWLYKRCGKSEEAHSIMKEDLAGGKLPSDDFGVNAAWWWIMIIALNLNNAMKRLVLGKAWFARRMKAIRFHLINLPARVVERSRELFIRLSKHNPCLDWLIMIREKIGLLALASPD